MRISDWSSDVCSSDLIVPRGAANSRPFVVLIRKTYDAPMGLGRIFTGDQKIAATTIGSRALSRFLAGKRHDIAHVSHPARTIAPPSRSEEHTSDSSHSCAHRMPSSA